VRFWVTLIISTVAVLGLHAQPASQASAAAQASLVSAVSSSLEPDEVLAHLGRTITWFHRLQALEPDAAVSDDLVARDRLRETSTAALQLSFDFARASVPLVKAPPQSEGATADASGGSGSAASSPSNLERAVTRSAERVAQLQSRLTAIDADREKAKTKAERDTLSAQHDEIAAALALAKDVQATVQNLAQFAARGSGGQGTAGLAGQITQLERSVPEARRTGPGAKGGAATPAAAPAAGQAPASQTTAPAAGVTVTESNLAHPETAGLIALSAELLTLRARRQEMGDLLRQTDAVLKGIDDIRTPLIASTREFMKQTDTLSTAAHDAEEAARTRQALQSAAGQFKQLSTVIVPLAEQAIATEAARGTIAEWRDRLSAQIGTTARYLFFRASMLAALLIVILLLS
jgi:hypothetical protein